MNLKVLLVHPRYGEETKERIFYPGIEFPISLAYLSAYLERSGIMCDVLDLRLKDHSDSTLAQYIASQKPLAVGITASTANIENADHVARTVKQVSGETKTIIGGWHASALPEDTLRKYKNFDYLVHGEGERAFANLLQSLADSKSPTEAKGVAYRDDGTVVVNPRDELIRNLDELPFPSRHKLPIRNYQPTPATRNYRHLPSTGIVVGRGCPYRCLFCYKGVWGQGVRYRSPENVIAEIEMCMEQYDIRDFRFYDDTITSPRWDLAKFCSLIDERHLDISWNCWSRVNDVDEAKLRMMKEAGCYHIKFGIEFGTERSLKLAKKGATLEQAKRAVELAKKLGIECKGSFIFGIPFEGKEDCARTVDFALNLSPDFATFYAFDPIPGSPYHKKIVDREIDPARDMLSREVSQQIADRAYRAFYLRPRFVAQRLKAIASDPTREMGMMLNGLGMAASYWVKKLRPPSNGFAPAIAQTAVLEVPAPVERTRAAKINFGETAKEILASSVSACALAVSSPLIALIAVAIKLTTPGPALFRQVRVGQNRRRNGSHINATLGSAERRKRDIGGKPFVFYKFRTMYADAADKFPELYEYKYTPEEISRMCFKRADDPRLTPLGAYLRRTTLDELPNFINVLKGDMNLIGPRPDIPEMVPYYENWQKKKFLTRPGITGLAQVNGRGLLTFQETLRFDVDYVEKTSLWLDLKILLHTIRVSLSRLGAF